MAQTQTEATSNPSMTVFTIHWAFQNNVKIDRSEEASGNADCVRSAAFMGYPFASPRNHKDRSDAPSRTSKGIVGGISHAPPANPKGRTGISTHPSPTEDDFRANMSKLGR